MVRTTQYGRNDQTLTLCWRLDNGVHGDHYRTGQPIHQVEDIAAIMATKNAKLMLDGNHIDAQMVQSVRCALIVAAFKLADAHGTDAWINCSAFLHDRNNVTGPALHDSQRALHICREGRNPALARRHGANQRDTAIPITLCLGQKSKHAL